MSIPRLDHSSPFATNDAGVEDTALISRLLGEFFHGGRPQAPEVPATLPTTIAGLPTQLPLTPQAAPPSADSRDAGLNGGFPTTTSSAPPVHPTVVAPKAASRELELVFDLDQRSPLTTLFLVSGGAPIPLVRVVIAAVLPQSNMV